MTTNKRSGFEGGLWVIPVACLLGAIFCCYKSLKDSASFVSAPTTVFAVLLFVAAIAISIWMRKDR